MIGAPEQQDGEQAGGGFQHDDHGSIIGSHQGFSKDGPACWVWQRPTEDGQPYFAAFLPSMSGARAVAQPRAWAARPCWLKCTESQSQPWVW